MPKLLLIGFENIEGYDSASWAEKDFPNILDHEIVVLNMTTIPSIITSFGIEFVGEFNSTIKRFLSMDGKLIVLIDKNTNKYIGKISNIKIEYSMFFPFQLDIYDEIGTTIINENELYQKYLSNLKEWNFFFHLNYIENEIPFYSDSILINREGQYLAARCISPLTDMQVIVLPRINNMDDSKILEYILEEEKINSFNSIEPTWVDNYKLPDEIRIDNLIVDANKNIENIENDIHELNNEKQSFSKYKKLLYSTGGDLENIVSDVLILFGAEINPESYGNEEFIMIYKDKEYMVEVKGLNKSSKLNNVRQLLNHTLDAAEHLEYVPQGLFFVTTYNNIPLNERETDTNSHFPPNVIQLAEKNNLSLILNTDLYNQVSLFLNDKKTGEEILEEIVTQKPIVIFK